MIFNAHLLPQPNIQYEQRENCHSKQNVNGHTISCLQMERQTPNSADLIRKYWEIIWMLNVWSDFEKINNASRFGLNTGSPTLRADNPLLIWMVNTTSSAGNPVKWLNRTTAVRPGRQWIGDDCWWGFNWRTSGISSARWFDVWIDFCSFNWSTLRDTRYVLEILSNPHPSWAVWKTNKRTCGF